MIRFLKSLWGRFGKKGVLVLELSGEIPEVEEKKLIPFLPGGGRLTYWDVEHALSSAGENGSLAGVILKLSDLRIGPARANGIRRRLQSLRLSGRKVAVFLESGGNMEYLISSAADFICIPPWTTLNLTGLKAEVTFYKDFLDKLGITADIKGVGEYKSASETFTRSSMTEPHREMLESMVSELEARFEEAMSDGRNIPKDRVREIIDNGPYTAREALDAGLVDAVDYYSGGSFEDIFQPGTIRKVRGARYLRLLGIKDRLSSLYGFLRGRKNVIALVSDSGIITSGRSRAAPALKTMGSESVLEALDKLSRDRSVKALVFRVLTPGGSGGASDIIRNKLKQISGSRPVVVSMSDVAASGGYMIALGAENIVADPMTLTGSIGIVSGKFDLSGFYEKLGIGKENVKGAGHSMIFSSSTGFSPDEEQRLTEIMRQYYSEFVRDVSRARGIDYGSAERSAKGRVWTGSQALDAGLVDKLGGISEAVKTAASVCGLTDGYTVRYVSTAKRPRASSVLASSLHAQYLSDVISAVDSFKNETVLAILPYIIKIE